MEKKPKPLASKAQASHVYQAYKQGKVSYPDMMAAVHNTDFSKIPDRVAEKKAVGKKFKAGVDLAL